MAAGIYIHVPFCYQRCHYCDFYSTINLTKRGLYKEKLLDEIEFKKDFIKSNHVDTIYFGGGTPSLMEPSDINYIINMIKKCFVVEAATEITLEANPDDISQAYLDGIINSGINRISLGIQSFKEEDLIKLNRRHNSQQAIEAVGMINKAGFDNVGIDLIYGLPGQSLDDWVKNLEKASEMNVNHISAYNLTYEKGTLFYRWLKEGKIKESSDQLSLEMFQKTIDILGGRGFEHYEISNYARDMKISRHNTKYWFGEQYIGLGPSAHSYNGSIRQWNISDLAAWLKNDPGDKTIYRREEIDIKIRRNEMLMTRLRTMWGIPEVIYTKEFGEESWGRLVALSKPFIERGLMQLLRGRLIITNKGKFLSDGIISDLFII